MGEQRNLTEGNVEELKAQLKKMQQDNPKLEYRFFKQDENDNLCDICPHCGGKIERR